LKDGEENARPRSDKRAASRPARSVEESFVPGRPPDPATTRVGLANRCPGCGSAEVRTLCSGEDFLYHSTERTFLFVECQQCRMVRLYPRPEPDEIRRYYPPALTGSGQACPPGRLSRFVQRLLMRGQVKFVRQTVKRVPWGGPVLDVGCGTGRFLRELNLPQQRLVGLDFSVDAAAEAWASNAVPAVCGALTSPPFATGLFAAITMFQVLEHLYDPSVYVQAAALLLHPEGRLIVQVPNAGAWQFVLFGERWSGLDMPRHLMLFYYRDLENLLDYCGFEIVRRKRFSLSDDPTMLATSLVPSLNPRVRLVRGVEENDLAAIVKHLLFGLFWLLALPIAAIESACHGGASLIVEARLKRPAAGPD
jgi:SAM-dependent methyltransferase